MMSVKLIKKGTTGDLLFIGRLDSASAPDVEKIAKDMVNRYTILTLDLTQMEYTSSAGLRILLYLHQELEQKGGCLYVKGTSPAVMELFEMTGLSSFLNFVQD